MSFELGVKSDPIEYRYSYDWLFDLMRARSIGLLQLGSFFELYSLDDSWFVDLRTKADSYGIRIKSVFTAHRELGGFFVDDSRFEKVARKNYERLIEVASLLGADYVGANPGAVYRDRMDGKMTGITRYLAHLKELSHRAKELGLKALTIEPMSCSAEPPSTIQEIESMLAELAGYHENNRGSTVPFHLCGDVSHGLADVDQKVIHGNMELFDRFLPDMCEFHFKNTDAIFGSTFGFNPEERKRGIVDVEQIVKLVRDRKAEIPADEFVGYLEIGGPKLGRDYSDPLLETQLSQSLEYLKHVMTTIDHNRPR